MNLRTMPLPFKVLATCFLLTIGVGYLFALAYLYLIDLKPHATQGLDAVQSVIVKYYGNRDGSRLEAALEGNMRGYATPADKQQIIRWLRHGAPEAEFDNIQPILARSCAGCHHAQSESPLPPLTSYADVSEYTAVDAGQSVKSLVRVSHIHLFGMSFIFMLTSIIFAFSGTSLVLRSVLIAIPFLAIWLDIGSWWFTKYAPAFAYTVIVGGVLMGLSLAVQIGVSLYEMWFVGVSKVQG
ncbi:MAG: hypothetical protein ACKOCD_11610 [Nitrospiraceae bacterium]